MSALGRTGVVPRRQSKPAHVLCVPVHRSPGSRSIKRPHRSENASCTHSSVSASASFGASNGRISSTNPAPGDGVHCRDHLSGSGGLLTLTRQRLSRSTTAEEKSRSALSSGSSSTQNISPRPESTHRAAHGYAQHSSAAALPTARIPRAASLSGAIRRPRSTSTVAMWSSPPVPRG